MASVTFSASVGGDGSTVTDDNNPSTGLGNGGHRTRFVPALAQLVAVAQFVVNAANGMVNGLFAPVRVASATGININLAAPGATIDGITMATNDRFLAKDQSTGSQNGIYVYNGSATPATRATDADGNAEWVGGKMVGVQEGATNAETAWRVTNDGTITVGSTSIAFVRNPVLGLPNTWTALQSFTGNVDFGNGVAQYAGMGTGANASRMFVTDQAIGSLASGAMVLTQNANYNSGWKKLGAGFASAFGVSAGVFYFYVSNAGAGAGGDAITWTLQASLDTSSILKQGTTAVALTGKQQMWIPVSAMRARVTNGPAGGSQETATNKLNFGYLDFDASTNEFAQFTWAPPKSWDNGTVTFEAIWTTAGGTAAQTVLWGLQGVAISDDDVIDAAFGTGIEVSDAMIATTDQHRTAESAAVTIAGTPATGDNVVFQVYRNAAAGGDTLTVDARLIGIRLNYTTNVGNDA